MRVRLSEALVMAGICLLYVVTGKLGLRLAFFNPSATAVWVPTGIALAALLLFAHRVWPAIFVGAFAVNVTTTPSIGTSLGISVGNTLEAAAPRGDAPKGPARNLESVPRRTLVVEDNQDAREALSHLLELDGHEVRQAADGPGAVEEALRWQPEVALIDIGLPGIDGYEVVRRIRMAPAGRRMVLVALTGYGLPEDRQRAREAGFDRHVVKPIDSIKLAEVLALRERDGDRPS